MLRNPVHRHRAMLAVLLAGSGLIFTWDLDVSGFANSYYSAAALAGSESWKAFFFGSLDPANAITVDKPPLALWPMALSVRAFGMSSWSLLLPQAVEGVASVALLYACVRRLTWAVEPALLSGLVFALTPVTALVFRYNNPDALLTLVLLAAAYATARALDSNRPAWWLVLAGTCCGLGFLTKMLEAFLVVPALALTYLLYGNAPAIRRLFHLLAGSAALVIAAGWWVLAVELWPRSDRPFIGGSSTNSVLELTFGYNGIGRLTGQAGTTATSGGLGATNIARIGRTDLGGEVMWLLPAAIVLGILAWRISRHHEARRRLRAGLVLWSSWLFVTSATFAGMVGIFHSYYTVVLAPAVAALVSTGAWLGWEARHEPGVRRGLAVAVLLTTVLAAATLLVVGHSMSWVAVPVLSFGVVIAVALHPSSGPPQVSSVVAGAALGVCLAGPALFVLATVQLPHVGSGPMAGPGNGATTTTLAAYGTPSSGEIRPFPGYLPLDPRVVDRLAQGSERYRWAAATMGARSAAAYQLAIDEPVLAIGGYKGTDPVPTLPEFQRMVGAKQLHWLVGGGLDGPSGRAIDTWVSGQFRRIVVDGLALYDLSAPKSSGVSILVRNPSETSG